MKPHAATDATETRPRGRRFLTMGEIASQLSVNRSTVTLVESGTFPAFRLGPPPRGRVLIPKTSLRRGCTPTKTTLRGEAA